VCFYWSGICERYNSYGIDANRLWNMVFARPDIVRVMVNGLLELDVPCGWYLLFVTWKVLAS
jgi:hypothetical protein